MSRAKPPGKIYKVDRTNLNLPASKECESCRVMKPSDAFQLKHRNRFDKAHELADICRACNKLNRGIKEGLFLGHIKSGQRILSDKIIEMLQANKDEKLSQLANTLINYAIAGDKDAWAICKSVIQPPSPIQHMSSRVMDSMMMDEGDEEGAEVGPTPGDGADLLSRLPSANTK